MTPELAYRPASEVLEEIASADSLDTAKRLAAQWSAAYRRQQDAHEEWMRCHPTRAAVVKIKARKLPGNKYRYPFPTLVAEWHGRRCRMSFWTPAGKPFDWKRAEAMMTNRGHDPKPLRMFVEESGETWPQSESPVAEAAE